MASVDASVRDHLLSDLNERSKAISGGALQRNGTISEETTEQIQFSALGRQTESSEKTRESPADECPVCNRSSESSVAMEFRDAPFKSGSIYSVVRSDGHHEHSCRDCSGTGRIDCWSCEGDGYVECFDCRGTGVEQVCEECNICGGQSETEDCQACGGDGMIEYKQSCEICDGTGQEECRSCNGDGLEECSRCGGAGVIHDYRTYEATLSVEYSTTGLPAEWADHGRATASALELPLADFSESGERYWVQTETVEAAFVVCEYAGTDYRAVVTNTTPEASVAWHPAASYPETNLRRKASDLKARLLSRWTSG